MGTEKNITVQGEHKSGTRAWVSPQVSRLRAGSAELGDISTADGNVFS